MSPWIECVKMLPVALDWEQRYRLYLGPNHMTAAPGRQSQIAPSLMGGIDRGLTLFVPLCHTSFFKDVLIDANRIFHHPPR